MWKLIQNRRAPIALPAALVVGLSAAAGALALNPSSNDGRAVAPAPPNHAQASKVDDRLASHLAVLDRSEGLSPTDAAALQAVEHHAASAHFGLNDGLARRVGSGVRGRPIFVVPGDGYACLRGIDVGNTCVAADFFNRGRPDVNMSQCGSIPQGEVALYGLVPNGVADLVLHRSSGPDESVTIANNAYFLETSLTSGGLPTSLSWNSPTGEPGTLDLQLPDDATTAVCGPEAS